MKYYKTRSYGTLIKEIEVTRETDKCVYVVNKHNNKEERVVKLTTYENYFASYDEAKCFLQTTKKIKIEQIERSLERQKSELNEINKL
jgi:hypothetical protein